jgi:GNAT superfamily N-acetyltransferase
MANERFWWVKPDERAKGVGAALFDAIVDAAKRAGCQKLVMISLAGKGQERVDDFYQSKGLVKTEHCFMRDL